MLSVIELLRWTPTVLVCEAGRFMRCPERGSHLNRPPHEAPDCPSGGGWSRRSSSLSLRLYDSTTVVTRTLSPYPRNTLLLQEVSSLTLASFAPWFIVSRLSTGRMRTVSCTVLQRLFNTHATTNQREITRHTPWLPIYLQHRTD